MGGGTYSSVARTESGRTAFYSKASSQEIFKQKTINNAMNPFGLTLRESRDSVEHPNSLAIIVGLDVTGSMGSVPNFLVKNGLPEIMDSIIKAGIADPQMLFLGIGDHEFDRSPLQVGQFESSDELLDHWLTTVYLEGGGGGNDGESYLLAWYLAAMHTEIDCFEKRGQKGILITIGDEPCLYHFPKSAVKNIMGDEQAQDYNITELFDIARGKYHVHHIHIKQTGAGSRQSTIDGWKQMLSNNLHIAERQEDVARIIANIVVVDSVVDESIAEAQIENVTVTNDSVTSEDEGMML